MIQRPLAYLVRPTSFDEIIGQDHLVGKEGVLRKMAKNKRFSSLILYGKPGIGKTTIATVMGEAFGLNMFTFNASTDNKAQLKEIIAQAKHYGVLLIVDEIHRMKKDIQDYLLPHVEKGDVIMIGITTNNPYHSVNPAVRSRAHVYKLREIKHDTLVDYLKKLLAKHADDLNITVTNEALDYIVQSSNREIRSAINRLELLAMTYAGQKVDVAMAEAVVQRPVLSLDKDEDNYYALLSALQKSIRGSDVDASLHYLARLILMEDLDSILRRLSVIAYEDIGLANPAVFNRVEAAASASLRVGFPEARIILSALVIDLALSPKSNSAYLAIDKALADLESGKDYPIPTHLINIDTFEEKGAYKYPHNDQDHISAQQYLPKGLENTRYYEGVTTGKYEEALKIRNELIKKRLKGD